MFGADLCVYLHIWELRPKLWDGPFFSSLCLFTCIQKLFRLGKLYGINNKVKRITKHSILGHNSWFSLKMGIPRLTQIFNLAGMKCHNLQRIYQFLVHPGICGIKMFGLIHSFRKYATWETLIGLHMVYPVWKTIHLPSTPNQIGSVCHFILHFICIIIT